MNDSDTIAITPQLSVNKGKIIIMFLIFCFLTFSVFARQEYEFARLDNADGLSNNQI